MDPASPENKGIEIDSFATLYGYGESVLKSNIKYMFSKLSDNSDQIPDMTNHNNHANLLATTKAAVKRVMEETATKKILYFDNITVNALCASVETCLLDGLLRRTVGLFEDSQSLGLLKKLSRTCESANQLLIRLKTFNEQSNSYSNGCSSYTMTNGGGGGLAGLRFFSESDSSNIHGTTTTSNSNSSNLKSPGTISLPSPFSGWFNKQKTSQIKYLWIKLAFVDKKLFDIVEHVISKYSSFYDDTSLMANSLSSRLFLDLIAGPCSLDYTMVRPSEHLWTEPDASELIDRHRIHSNNPSWQQALYSRRSRRINSSGVTETDLNELGERITNSHQSFTAVSRPNLKINYYGCFSNSLKLQDSVTSTNPIQSVVLSSKANTESNNNNNNNSSNTNINCNINSNITNTNTVNSPNSHAVAKEYVESLHQSVKNVLLYGKNNVIVQPREEYGNMQGYLSLHQMNDKLYLKWTPNQLMNHQPKKHITDLSTTANEISTNLSQETYSELASNLGLSNKIVQWDSSLSINMDDIVYLHCHQREDKCGKITLVCQDGVQQPPLYFPPGGHLLQFLICLENGLLPLKRLEPPLHQINDADKTFPQILRKQSSDSSMSDDSRDSRLKRSAATGSSSPSSSSIGMTLFSHFNRSFRRKHDLTSQHSPTNVKNISIDSSTSSSSCDCDFVFRIVYISLTNNSLDSNLDLSSSMGASAKSNFQFHWDTKDETTNENDKSVDQSNSINTLCNVMSKQILSRAFYGWLQYYRNLKTVRTKFSNLVLPGAVHCDSPSDASEGLTKDVWDAFKAGNEITEEEIYRLIYFGGCYDKIRPEIWPRLLEHYPWKPLNNETIDKTINDIDCTTELLYEKSLSQWRALEIIVIQRQNEQQTTTGNIRSDAGFNGGINSTQALIHQMEVVIDSSATLQSPSMESSFESATSSTNTVALEKNHQKLGNEDDLDEGSDQRQKSSVNISNCDLIPSKSYYSSEASSAKMANMKVANEDDDNASSGTPKFVTNVSTDDDFAFTDEQIDSMADNLHRIDKDVDRCDRNYSYFSCQGTNRARGKVNLKKLRNIMVTWVWQNIEVGYVQGMCDLLAPLLVVLDNESLAFACFTKLMKRMINNFPQMGSQMDETLEMMALLLQIIDNRLYDHMCSDGEFTSLYVTYRWFLLDFKREMKYEDIFPVWETIWSSGNIASKHFNLFLALSMLQYYREIILDNKMEYTDIIKFFNEMAEKHQVQRLLFIARDLIESIRDLLLTK